MWQLSKPTSSHNASMYNWFSGLHCLTGSILHNSSDQLHGLTWWTIENDCSSFLSLPSFSTLHGVEMQWTINSCMLAMHKHARTHTHTHTCTHARTHTPIINLNYSTKQFVSAYKLVSECSQISLIVVPRVLRCPWLSNVAEDCSSWSACSAWAQFGCNNHPL